MSHSLSITPMRDQLSPSRTASNSFEGRHPGVEPFLGHLRPGKAEFFWADRHPLAVVIRLGEISFQLSRRARSRP